MREIILDTETTGLDHATGDRIVEIGAIELVERFPTGRSYHAYINPQRAMHPDAERVHGLTGAFLADKPLFAACVEEFIAFVGDATLVIHNAAFDIGFINAELTRTGHPLFRFEQVIDTLPLARRKHPGAQNSLDALCSRYGIDNSNRVKHGALLDAELLAEVYIELTGGRQTGLALDAVSGHVETHAETAMIVRRPRPTPLPSALTPECRAAHLAFVATLGGSAVWRDYLAPARGAAEPPR